MINRKTFSLAFAAALAFGLIGCGSDSGSGTGGTGGAGGTGGTGGAGGSGGSAGGGGEGGSGGAPGAVANVTAVHLAPEIPSAEDTEVAIFVNGEEQPLTLSYGQIASRVPLPAGTYDIGLGLPGDDAPLLQLEDVELNGGDDVTVVAYRTNEDLPVDVFVFNNSTDGLAMGSGRVFVAHGANDPALDPVTISTSNEDGTADCATLIPDFAFGTSVPGAGDPNLDVPEGTLNVGFDLGGDECPEVGPVPVPVTADVVSVVVAVDENTSNEAGELAPELWGIVDATTLVRLINTDMNP